MLCIHCKTEITKARWRDMLPASTGAAGVVAAVGRAAEFSKRCIWVLRDHVHINKAMIMLTAPEAYSVAAGILGEWTTGWHMVPSEVHLVDTRV